MEVDSALSKGGGFGGLIGLSGVECLGRIGVIEL